MSDPTTNPEAQAIIQRQWVGRRFGLDLSADDLAELGEALERINQAEREWSGR